MFEILETQRDSDLGFLAEVRGQFEAGDVASVVAHGDDGIDGVEFQVRQLGLSGHN